MDRNALLLALFFGLLAVSAQQAVSARSCGCLPLAMAADAVGAWARLPGPDVPEAAAQAVR